MTQVVRFKSLPNYWQKEKDGRKPNTIRKIKDEEKFEILLKFMDNEISELNIIIHNTFNGESFERQIKDVTEWNNLLIISWRT